MGRAYNCWMLNCWWITWPVGFNRLSARARVGVCACVWNVSHRRTSIWKYTSRVTFHSCYLSSRCNIITNMESWTQMLTHMAKFAYPVTAGWGSSASLYCAVGWSCVWRRLYYRYCIMQWASRATRPARRDLPIACEKAQRVKGKRVTHLVMRTLWLAQHLEKFILTQRI